MSPAAVPPPDRSVAVRVATLADIGPMQAIYAHHVLHSLGTFEETPPDMADMTSRFRARVDQGLPWLVAEREGHVLGYAYASFYHARSAYRFTLEDSVYIRADCLKRGIGRALLADLIDACTALGSRQMVAVIGDGANHGSVGLHAALGFRRVGQLEAVGFKFGRWVDVVIMQRPLGVGGSALPGENEAGLVAG